VAQRFKAIPGNGQVDRQDESTLVLTSGELKLRSS
jgi:hypothetical protein